MSLSDELEKKLKEYFEGSYEVTQGKAIPDITDIDFGNNGRELDLAMLFIDIRESTKIVDAFRRTTAARMYKSFLYGISKIARANDGELRSFNGDGVLVAFIGDMKRTHAVKSAMQMSWFCKNILKPKLDTYFQNNSQLNDIEFNFGIGIDVGKVLAVRGGIKGSNNNDLVWAGNPTNYAVKLSNLSDEGYHIFITEDVYNRMNDSSKLNDNLEVNMWEKRSWNGLTVYRTQWNWLIS